MHKPCCLAEVGAESSAQEQAANANAPEGVPAVHLRTIVRKLMAERMPGVRHAAVQADALLPLVLWVDMLEAPARISVMPAHTAYARLQGHSSGHEGPSPLATSAGLVKYYSPDAATRAHLKAHCAPGAHPDFMPAVVLTNTRPTWCPHGVVLAPLEQERMRVRDLEPAVRAAYLERLKHAATACPSLLFETVI